MNYAADNEKMPTRITLDMVRLRELLSLIAGGMTIPGYKGPHPDERVAMLQEVMHAAQTYAKEALMLIEGVSGKAQEAVKL